MNDTATKEKRLSTTPAALSDIPEPQTAKATIGLWEWELASRTITWSEGMYSIHDLNREDEPPTEEGKIALSLQCYDPDARAQIRSLYERCIAAGDPYDFESGFTTLKGRRLRVRTTFHAMIVDGAITKVLGCLIDLSEQKQAEENLRDENQRRITLMNATRDGIVIINQQHQVVEANSRFADMLGCPIKEVLGMYTWEYEATLSEEQIRAQFADLSSTNTVLETRHRRKDGTVFEVEVAIAGAKVGGEAIVLAICRDITENKRAARIFRQFHALGLNLSHAVTVEETLRLALSAALDISGLDCGGIYLFNTDTGGLDLAEHMGLPPSLQEEAWHVRSGDKRLSFVLQGQAAYIDGAELDTIFPDLGQKLASLAVIPIIHQDHVIACLNLGSLAAAEVPVPIRPHLESLGSQLGGYLARALMEKVLRESRSRYSTLFEHAPIAVWEQDFSPLKSEFDRLRADGITDFAGYFADHPDEVRRYAGLAKILQSNQASLTIFQGSDADELNRNLPRFFNQDSLKVLARELTALADGSLSFQSEFPIIDCLGRRRDLIMRLMICPGYETDLSRVLVSFLDITDRKLEEDRRKQVESQLRQAQKMEAIGTLAGGIAHDFNNILGAIVGYGEMALEDAREGRTVPGDIAQILKAAERARVLVKQILTFSRKVDLAFKPMNLNRQVEQAVLLLSKTVPKMICLHTELAPDLWSINADASQIEQILLNLTVNAADAMNGEGSITIRTANVVVKEQLCMTCGKVFSGPHATLEVIDAGYGMDEQTIKHIFEPFYTTKEVGKGTGLGLSTVYGIVMGHGGHVICSSQPGAGTRFMIFFPVDRIDDSETASEILSDAKPIVEGKERILIVDDEEAILTLVTRQLRQAGYDILIANRGEMALTIYREQADHIDLVIMDLSMPGMGGYRALKELLEINPEVSVIIASGYAAKGQVQDALALGAAAYVAKPFKQKELLAAVRRVLDGKAPRSV